MFNRILKLWQLIVIRFRVRKIVSVALNESWPNVRLKTAGLPTLRASEYAGRHAVAIAHRQVELFMLRNPTIDGGTANLMIVKASERLYHQLLRKLAKEPRVRLRLKSA